VTRGGPDGADIVVSGVEGEGAGPVVRVGDVE
jgi:hypothetical protein